MALSLSGESASNNGSMVKNDSAAKYSLEYSALDSGAAANLSSKDSTNYHDSNDEIDAVFLRILRMGQREKESRLGVRAEIIDQLPVFHVG